MLCITAKLFQWVDSTISIDGTLQGLGSPLRFFSL